MSRYQRSNANHKNTNNNYAVPHLLIQWLKKYIAHQTCWMSENEAWPRILKILLNAIIARKLESETFQQQKNKTQENKTELESNSSKVQVKWQNTLHPIPSAGGLLAFLLVYLLRKYVNKSWLTH